jgi:hypothetical protein
MRAGPKLLRRVLAAGLAGAAALCLIFGLAVWQLAGSSGRRQPGSGAAARLDPPPLTFWDRADLLLFRGRAAHAAARSAGGAIAAPGPAAGAERPVGASPGQPAAGRDPYRQTAEDDSRELALALSRLDMAETRRRSLLDEYRRLRAEWLLEDERAAGERRASQGLFDLDPAGAAVPAVPRPAPAVEPALPPGLPIEFGEYLQGAFAYRRGDPAAAAGHWQRLLALPDQERHYRSTWAAFMLGRAALRRSPRDLDAAVGWFRRTRELAAHGFADSLDLSVASLGWEARANAARRRYDRAEALYAQQADAGDPSAVDSLRILWRERLLHGILGN